MKYQNLKTNFLLPKSTRFRKPFPKSSFRVISSDRHWFSKKWSATSMLLLLQYEDMVQTQTEQWVIQI